MSATTFVRMPNAKQMAMMGIPDLPEAAFGGDIPPMQRKALVRAMGIRPQGGGGGLKAVVAVVAAVAIPFVAPAIAASIGVSGAIAGAAASAGISAATAATVGSVVGSAIVGAGLGAVSAAVFGSADGLGAGISIERACKIMIAGTDEFVGIKNIGGAAQPTAHKAAASRQVAQKQVQQSAAPAPKRRPAPQPQVTMAAIAEQDFDERRLPSPVASEQAKDFASFDFKRNPLQRFLPFAEDESLGVGLAEVGNGDGRRGHEAELRAKGS